MNYKEILHSLDEKNYLEYPQIFDYEKLNRRVHRVFNDLNKELDCNLNVEEGLSIQDASYHADIILKEYKSEHFIGRICLRFSNFGNIVAFTDEAEIGNDWRKVICDTLNKYDFMLIPLDILDEKYDGCNKVIDSWWIRFFDYL